MFIDVDTEKMGPLIRRMNVTKDILIICELIRERYPDVTVVPAKSKQPIVEIEGKKYRIGLGSKGIFLKEYMKKLMTTAVPSVNIPEQYNLSKMDFVGEVVCQGAGEQLIPLPEDITMPFVNAAPSARNTFMKEIILKHFPHAQFLPYATFKVLFESQGRIYRAGLIRTGIRIVVDRNDPQYKCDIVIGGELPTKEAVVKIMELLGPEAGFLGLVGAYPVKPERRYFAVFELNGQYFRAVRNAQSVGYQLNYPYKITDRLHCDPGFYVKVNYPNAPEEIYKKFELLFNRNRLAGKVLKLEAVLTHL